MRVSGMAQTVCVIVSAEDRARLAAIIGDRSRPLKHMQRARIVLQSADRLPALEISRRAGVSRPAVWRWQRHYAEKGVERLLHEGSRKPGKSGGGGNGRQGPRPDERRSTG
jgi:hypothetical protein